MEGNECGSDTCDREICAAGLLRYREALEGGSLHSSSTTRCLRTLGLLEPIHGETGLFAPVEPAVAAGRALRPHEREVAARRQQIHALTSAFDSIEAVYAVARRERLPDTTVLRGHRTISQTIDAAADTCRKELITAQPGGRRPPEILDAALERNLLLLQRGVRQRTLYQHAVRAHVPTFDYISRVAEAGAEVRTVDEMFDRLIICDRSVAYIPTGTEYAEEALEIRHPAIIRFLADVFEYAWGRGVSVDPRSSRRPQHVVTEVEQSIMRMLVAGCTEDRIARDVGISRRTVAEHVSRISKRLGSASRAQLGYLIATNEILESPATEPPA